MIAIVMSPTVPLSSLRVSAFPREPNLLFVSLAVVAAMLVSVTGCHSSSAAQSQQANSLSPVRVTMVPLARKTLRRESVQPGQIEAFEKTPLFAKLPSYVQKLYVDIGDRVEADQPIVDLFLPELKDELRQKEAATAEAQSQIELATAAIRAAEAAVATAQANIRLAEAGLRRAEADVAPWQSQFTRISRLANDGALDRKLEDETRGKLKAAEASQSEAHAKVDAAKAALLQSQADLAKAKANGAVARARHGIAEADHTRVKTLLQYTQIRAPYAGVVTERNVNRGDYVQPASAATSKPLFTVTRMDTVRVFVEVPEIDSPWVEAGHAARVNIQALPDQIIEGKVTRTSWALGSNRTLRTELDLPNPNGLLRPGMYATAHILLQERPNALVLPVSAIVRDGKKTVSGCNDIAWGSKASCWITKNGHAAQVPITLGLQVGSDVEIAAGLKGDEQVIQSQAGALQEGQPIKVVK